MTTRRGFLFGLGALVAAPLVVRAESLMPIRGVVMPTREILTGDRVFYIATDGLDTNDGLDPSRPMRTIQKAINGLVFDGHSVEFRLTSGFYGPEACFDAGDEKATISVRGGDAVVFDPQGGTMRTGGTLFDIRENGYLQLDGPVTMRSPPKVTTGGILMAPFARIAPTSND